MTDSLLFTVVGTLPFLVSDAIGSCSAMACTLLVARLFDAVRGRRSGATWALLIGRRPSRSNTEPRSTKNGSLRWPANTLPPPGSDLIDAAVYCE